MADWLRFHFVIARRRYTGSSAPADSADCRFSDMARGRERGKEGGREGGREIGREGRGGEGRGGDCPHFPQTRTFVTAEPSRPPAKPLLRLAGHKFRGWPASIIIYRLDE